MNIFIKVNDAWWKKYTKKSVITNKRKILDLNNYTCCLSLLSIDVENSNY